MRISRRATARTDGRHRAHHIRPKGLLERSFEGGCGRTPAALEWLAQAALWLGAASCGGSVPQPPSAPASTADYVAVPFAPKPPPPEYVPPRPVKNAVWMDGTWQWVGDRYVWRFGSWVVPPTGARRARWVLVRRPEDGQLFFAPSSWKDAEGNKIEERAWVYALGSAARARARPGASAPLPSDADILVAPPPEEELDE